MLRPSREALCRGTSAFCQCLLLLGFLSGLGERTCGRARRSSRDDIDIFEGKRTAIVRGGARVLTALTLQQEKRCREAEINQDGSRLTPGAMHADESKSRDLAL